MTHEQKLTEEQLQAAWETWGESRYIDVFWGKRLTAAAPHLQYPIAPPTEEEIERAFRLERLPSPNGCVKAVLTDFVNRRNNPTPPDPRIALLCNAGFTHYDALKAIAALDTGKDVFGKMSQQG